VGAVPAQKQAAKVCMPYGLTRRGALDLFAQAIH
jgi:hypothetical protein